MKTYQKILLAVALLFLVAVVSNPDTAKHQEVIKSELKKIVGEEMNKKKQENLGKEGDQWEKAGEALGSLFANSMIDALVGQVVSADSYFLFSITQATWEGKTKNIGIGAFGKVWLFGDLKDMNSLKQSEEQ